MEILVTGGSGFIGRHLCRKLLDQGHSVISLDLKEPEASPGTGVRHLQGDVRDGAQLSAALEDVDAVVHFAAIVSVPLCDERPVESYETNLLATVRLLDLLEQKKRRTGRATRLIFASSSAVYGNTGTPESAHPEDRALGHPQSHYAAQKLGSEHAIGLFHKRSGLPCVVFRFFNVFGPGQDPNSPYSGVISIFRKRIASGEALTLNDAGRPTRDFISVHDIVRACLLALELPESECSGVPMNLGSGRSVSIRELASAMIEVAGRKVALQDAPARPGDVLHSRADIERARKILGWQPEVTLNQGLQELLSFR